MEWMYEGEGCLYTVFPIDPEAMPQDFPTKKDAQSYGDEVFGAGNYIVQRAK